MSLPTPTVSTFSATFQGDNISHSRARRSARKYDMEYCRCHQQQRARHRQGALASGSVPKSWLRSRKCPTLSNCHPHTKRRGLTRYVGIARRTRMSHRTTHWLRVCSSYARDILDARRAVPVCLLGRVECTHGETARIRLQLDPGKTWEPTSSAARSGGSRGRSRS